MRTSQPRRRDCGRCPPPRATSSSGAPGGCDLGGSLAVGCRTANGSSSCACHPPHLHQVSVFAHEPRTVSSTLYSLSTPRRRLHDSGPTGASDKLDGSRQVVRIASTTEEVTQVKGHHGAQLHGATAYETNFGPVVAHQVHVQTPLAVLQLQPRATRAADGVTEAVRALGRAELHTERGNLLLKKLSQGAGAIELMVGILPAKVPRIARLCRLVGVLQLAYGRLPSKPHASPGVQGGRATQRQKHESTVTVPLRPRDRPSEGARSRGRRVPIEGVPLLTALLARWRPDDEDRKQLLFVDGTTRPTRPDPMIHTPHEPPFDVQ